MTAASIDAMPGRHRLRTPALVENPAALASIDRIRREHLGWLLGRVDRLFAEGVTRAMHERGFAGVRLVHIALIRNVDADGTRITEVARRAGMTKSATSQLIAEFAELGYVHVLADPADGRARVARYTARGEELLLAIVRALADTESAFAARVGSQSMAQLKTLLAELLAADVMVSAGTEASHVSPGIPAEVDDEDR